MVKMREQKVCFALGEFKGMSHAREPIRASVLLGALTIC